jgi:hypothetical protein
MTLQLLHSEFPYIRGKFDFLFYQCILRESFKVCQQQRKQGQEESGRDGLETGNAKGKGKREGEGKDTYKDREKVRKGEREENDTV